MFIFILRRSTPRVWHHVIKQYNLQPVISFRAEAGLAMYVWVNTMADALPPYAAKSLMLLTM